ncbi:SDR family oxidoreductase [Microlunatus panaciterrae]|uniref:Uncharacterized protein YbjT (DUF2867 family) n=1 Tax=Microlunatus panaciterrae TaxID=400768 RepID=A0ABS2RR16_9ACTN|nr:SDR family oxidoreductase [Microlunatus panaciterrae]MBM7800611.1 uncharacterized protein YbjT (DUF2867 family) [Microlunatus panaciterrae]
MSTIAVTGVTGQVGGAVARQLSAAGVGLRLIGRAPERLPHLPGAEPGPPAHYGDQSSMEAALTGCATVFMVSAREDADRQTLHRNVVEAAVRARVERIVYLSFQGAAANCTFTFGRDHWYTEQLIRGSGLGYTFLRDSFYLAMLPALAGADGVIRGPAGTGRVAAVAHRDVADVAVTVLTGRGHDGQSYDVTGPEAITLADAAQTISRVSGLTVRYEEETLEEAYASRAQFGAPRFEVDGWVTSYLAIAHGEVSAVSDWVPRLTGHPAQGLEDFLRDNPQSYAHLHN